MTIKSYRDLRVYQISISLLEKAYIIAYLIPHLKFRDQIIRSSEAIPALVAEGFAKKRNPIDSARFYEMAMAESDEMSVHLEKAVILAKRIPTIPKDICSELSFDYISLSKQLNKLQQIQRSFSKK